MWGYLRNFKMHFTTLFCLFLNQVICTHSGCSRHHQRPACIPHLFWSCDCWLRASLHLRAFFLEPQQAALPSPKQWAVQSFGNWAAPWEELSASDCWGPVNKYPQLLCFSGKVSMRLDYAIFSFSLGLALVAHCGSCFNNLVVIGSPSSLYHFPHFLTGVLCTSQ